MGLNYKGHIFDGAQCACCVGDARKTMVDPTNTGPLRSKFRTTVNIKWRTLRVMVRQIIVDQDLFGLVMHGVPTQALPPSIALGSTKINAFQRWIDTMMERIVLQGDGSFMRPFLFTAYNDGERYAQRLTNTREVPTVANDRINAIAQLATVELQGVMEAVSQQAVRAVANALLHNLKPMQVVKQVWDVIDKIGITRSEAMIELLTVKAYGEATLDVFAAIGVQKVGLVPESFVKRKLGDARRRGPGSRSSRKVTPSRSTIARIRNVESQIEKLSRVNVRTAGDDDVCVICEAISENGPYTINKARSLIPAHPRCRCVFVPAGDRRFASDDYQPRMENAI
jgi:hypothetical protein